MIAEKWDISRDDMEAFAVESHHRAIRAARRGPLRRARSSRSTAVHARRGPARAQLGEDPLAAARWSRAAASRPRSSSQISDASAALLIASEQAVKDHGLTPRARIHHLSVRADDPICMLTAPIPATRVRPGEGGHDARRHRPGRDQRGVRVGRARVAEGDRLPTWPRSTSTAAPSPSATRSAPPAPG